MVLPCPFQSCCLHAYRPVITLSMRTTLFFVQCNMFLFYVRVACIPPYISRGRGMNTMLSIVTHVNTTLQRRLVSMQPCQPILPLPSAPRRQLSLQVPPDASTTRQAGQRKWLVLAGTTCTVDDENRNVPLSLLGNKQHRDYQRPQRGLSCRPRNTARAPAASRLPGVV